MMGISAQKNIIHFAVVTWECNFLYFSPEAKTKRD